VSEPIVTSRLELRLMSAEFIDAALAGLRAEAARIIGAALPPEWPSEDDQWLLGFRRKQMDTGSAPWLVRAIVRTEDQAFIGHIGFHGPPEDGIAEAGYTIFEPYRRQGYVEEAVRALFAWARAEHGVQRFRASISPDNVPSLALVNKLGFVQTGEQMDERDGLELIFEGGSPSPR
jgi:ribosomal-protein-alanine N-acetyltransferase